MTQYYLNFNFYRFWTYSHWRIVGVVHVHRKHKGWNVQRWKRGPSNEPDIEKGWKSWKSQKKVGWSETTNPSIPRTKALVTRNLFERIWGAELKICAALTNPPLCRFCPRRCKRNRRKWKTQSGHQTKIQPGWKTNCCSATNFWPVLEKKGIKTVDAISQCVW